MTSGRRLAICYAAPGLSLLASSGPTRNVLSLADALSEWADVTVAFRTILEPVATSRFQVIAIDPGTTGDQRYDDDNAIRGFHPLRHLAYCRTIRAFARTRGTGFDAVMEKGWRLSGLLATAARRAGVPALVVENDVRMWNEPIRGVVGLGKYLLHRSAEHVAASACRSLPVVIAETAAMKARLAALRAIPADQIEIVGLGVDHALFRPGDRQSGRALIGARPGTRVLLYVGAMDEYHDLAPVISALGQVGDASLELHVVGAGEYRGRYEAQAAERALACRFHGRVPHEVVPRYIAAADLCLAPYRTSAFHGGEVTFSTLKIPEYMASGRPVASVPSPAIGTLIQNGVNGFLLPNEASAWVSVLRALPDADTLDRMGAAAATAAEAVGWDRTARRYLDICEALVAGSCSRRRPGPAGDPAPITQAGRPASR